MKIIKDKKSKGYLLDLTEEEMENLKPFLNRYGFLDKFPQKDYPLGYPEPVDVLHWMFPEKITVVSKQSEVEAK